ncbi:MULTISPECIES: sensor histidine kinase [unclassified Streptomyces]|uniref:sensor histidine kinase n=1 Tax=unclassified Streptomyces TaxID=2593676 RepID=UPI00226D6063|nr:MULTISPECIES: ATP-binding protein [unclassified Streptomyces]MCY0924447.1 ATP-binding protein [Streptomyces sp. H27-G5]MCY0963134.1 ATP-binding protein [Streptomyces sp. H27-H5]
MLNPLSLLNPGRLRAVLRDRLTFRAKLVAAFTALFFCAGAALLLFVTVLARQGTMEQFARITINQTDQTDHPPRPRPTSSTSLRPASPTSPDPAASAGDVQGARQEGIEITNRLQEAAVRQMVLWSAVGLAVMAVLSGVMGWWLAGRALRPLRKVILAARSMSEVNLHERLQLAGPKDELRELGDTYDTMLDRLEKSFTSQRRFVANASHELRTPLAVQRTSIEVGLADPLPAHLIPVREDLLTTNHDAEHLIAALLLLARSDRGLDETEDTDLAELTRQAAGELSSLAAEHTVTTALHTTPLPLNGDPVLLKHLVSNLVRNAIQYNHPQGTVTVRVDTCRLTVTNSGPPIDPARVDGLFEPFRRLDHDRSAVQGHGLGLSIVRSIADAHGATTTAAPGPDGGLAITIRFP